MDNEVKKTYTSCRSTVLNVFLLLLMCLWGIVAIPPSYAAPQDTERSAEPARMNILKDMRRLYRGPDGPETPPRFLSLSPGAVRPEGWLRDWAEKVAEGITGQMDQRAKTFEHGWTGTDFEAKGEKGAGLHWPLEQSAYWLDGLVRMAYILDHPELKRKACNRLDRVVNGVHENDAPSLIWWEGKEALQSGFNNWAHSHMGRALVAYYRATGDERILDALVNAYKNYPLPNMKRDKFYPVSGATNVDPMLATYAMSGDRRILNRIVSSSPARLIRRDSGSSEADWATPSKSTGVHLSDIFVNRDGPIRFQARVESGEQKTLALAFCEGYWEKPGKRVLRITVEGDRSRTIDLIDHAGANEAVVLWFDARDENSDGSIDLRIEADESAEDRNTILNALWMFPSNQSQDTDALLRGNLQDRAISRATPRSCSVPFTQRPSFHKLIDQWSSGDLPSGHTVVFHENIRVPALTYPWTGNKNALNASKQAINWGLRRHGLPVGLASGEEYLMGTGPNRGLETCNIAAGPWMYQWMLKITGNRRYADLIEKAILNAGPAAISRSFRKLCYFQSPNRIDSLFRKRPHPHGGSFEFTPLGSNVLCCAGNVNRIIPFYVQHMWMATLNGGLAATLYGPSRVRSVVRNNVPVTIRTETNYPFRTRLTMTVTPEEPVTFPLSLRIPGWCHRPEVKVNGQSVDKSAGPGGFLTMERRWSPGDRIQLHLHASVEVHRGKTTPVPIERTGSYFEDTPFNQETTYDQPFATVTYGPLLFARALPDRSPSKNGSEDTSWRYAIRTESKHTIKSSKVIRMEMPEQWKWPLDAPLKIRLSAHPINWDPTPSQPLPDKPVSINRSEMITLIPYGSTTFRVSMFPVAD